MAHVDRKPPKIKEFIHIFTKSSDVRISPQFTEGEIDSEYNKFLEKHGSDDPMDWEVQSLASVLKARGIKSDEDKEDFILANAELIFNRVRNKTDAFTSTRGNQKLTRVITATGLQKWSWNGREVIWLSDRIVKDAAGNDTYQKALGDICSDIPIVNLYLEGGVDFPRGKKPEQLIRRILSMATKPGDLVLDFHAGSGTTAAVAHKMGRRWIAVEQMDYIRDLTVPRLKKVIEGEQGGVTESVDWQGGGSFVYAELAQFNAAFAARIEVASDTAALNSIWADMQSTGYLRPDVNTALFDADAIAALPLIDAKRLLMDCLDVNHLYVNLNSLGDADYDISDEDILATRSFYGINQ